MDRQKVFDERTIINRDAKALLSRIDALRPQEAPEEEVKIADLSAEVEKRMKVNEANKEVRDSINPIRANIETLQGKLVDIKTQRLDLESQAAAIKERLANLDDQRKTVQINIAEFQKQATEKEKEIAVLKDLPLDEIRKQISDAETINAKVRQNKQRAELLKEHGEKEKRAKELTSELEAADKKKSDAMTKAPFPVKGLGVDETGITFNDLPFGQASSEEKIRVGMAIAMAMSPSIKVIRISGGESLDTKHLTLILDMAEQSGYQVLMERVGDPGEIGIVIEDGMVKK
jgi:actin-related protein